MVLDCLVFVLFIGNHSFWVRSP